MSKKNNVNPDYYKTAGRERPGEDIVHDVYKRWYTQSRSARGAWPLNLISNARGEDYISESQTTAEIERRNDDANHKGAVDKLVRPVRNSSDAAQLRR